MTISRERALSQGSVGVDVRTCVARALAIEPRDLSPMAISEHSSGPYLAIRDLGVSYSSGSYAVAIGAYKLQELP
jgi:hypothetical protein